jgi:type I restriction enzyme S subunit
VTTRTRSLSPWRHEFLHFSIPAFDEGQWPKLELGEDIKSQKSRVPPGVVLLSKLNPEIERVWLVDVKPR